MLQETYNLLDDLARRVEVDETLVDLELVAVPSLRTFTARLERQSSATNYSSYDAKKDTYRLAGGDLEDLSGETDGALDAQRLVLRAVDQVGADLSTNGSAARARDNDDDHATHTSPSS